MQIQVFRIVHGNAQHVFSQTFSESLSLTLTTTGYSLELLQQ